MDPHLSVDLCHLSVDTDTDADPSSDDVAIDVRALRASMSRSRASSVGGMGGREKSMPQLSIDVFAQDPTSQNLGHVSPALAFSARSANPSHPHSLSHSVQGTMPHTPMLSRAGSFNDLCELAAVADEESESITGDLPDIDEVRARYRTHIQKQYHSLASGLQSKLYSVFPTGVEIAPCRYNSTRQALRGLLSKMDKIPIVPTIDAYSHEGIVEAFGKWMVHEQRVLGTGKREADGICASMLDLCDSEPRALGHGIDILIGMVPPSKGFTGKLEVTFARLKRPTNFDAPDLQPTEFVFFIYGSESEYLDVVALCRLLTSLILFHRIHDSALTAKTMGDFCHTLRTIATIAEDVFRTPADEEEPTARETRRRDRAASQGRGVPGMHS
ncbi:hypothetical protein KIPB_001475 [Kipferlia bialata]|uniref:Uncharacterized protein n=1 Tax=Kipferlia bialata TaxID=797122 RepID=A0A9K3CS10_9EUKA|nr:hypothetical protein KIPB_001475 [Kipferlia bialata]|eukprot:g1475.t1